MSLECGLVSRDEIEHAVRLTASGQAPRDWHTPSGSFVPRGSIADHINLDGKPIYFPGTYSYEKQGQPWGYLPSLDGHFYFVEMVWHLVKDMNDITILKEKIDGIPLIDRLELAFAVPPTGDFRKGEEFGSPFECIHPDENYQQNAVYLTSVTCPLAAFYRLGWVLKAETQNNFMQVTPNSSPDR